MASAALPVPAKLLRSWQSSPLPVLGRSSLNICCRAAKKGFGTGIKPRKDDDEELSSGPKGRVKRVRQRQQEPTPFREQETPSGALANVQLRRVEELEEQMRRESEDDDFMKRLEVIKLEGREKARDLPRSASGSTAGTSQGAAFDGPKQGSIEEDIYANPPSLGDTLLSQMNSEISDPALRSAKIGPGQLGLAAGALTIALIIVVVSGADYTGASKRFKGVRAKSPPPDGIEAKLLASRAATLTAKLEETPDDLATIEALAVTQAKLYNFPEATKLLDKLVAARPNDVEAWRLLGEAQLLNAQTGKSVAAFEKAAALKADDLQILTGLVDAYIANSQQKQAVDYLRNMRTTLAAQRAEQASTSSTSSSTSSSTPSSSSSSNAATSSTSSSGGDTTSAAASIATSEVAGTLQAPPLVDPAGSPAEASGVSTSSPDSSSASSSKMLPAGAPAKPQLQARPIDPVAVDLLLGKTYAAWRGHDTDASAAYDDLIRSYPEDFRGYLAKGVFLKEKGRKGDAERMFIQAKFYAPSDALRAFVAQKAGESPLTELPDNGME